jgi:hypothetical protein
MRDRSSGERDLARASPPFEAPSRDSFLAAAEVSLKVSSLMPATIYLPEKECKKNVDYLPEQV